MSRTQRLFSPEIEAIGGRIIDTLTKDFALSISEAATALGYQNATTLHKVRRGMALPDPARLAKFVAEQTILRDHTMNLHWIWTGHGPRLLNRVAEKKGARASENDDIINAIRNLKPNVKNALMVLIAQHRRNA